MIVWKRRARRQGGKMLTQGRSDPISCRCMSSCPVLAGPDPLCDVTGLALSQQAATTRECKWKAGCSCRHRRQCRWWSGGSRRNAPGRLPTTLAPAHTNSTLQSRRFARLQIRPYANGVLVEELCSSSVAIAGSSNPAPP